MASSLDGYISGPNGNIGGFVGTGSRVDKYLADLASFDTVIMGRHTYEFGYGFGLLPGRPAYPHMLHYIFSDTLKFENAAPGVHVKKIDINEVETRQKQPGTDIYLCRVGQFAGWLLDHKKIDILKLKLNPLILGRGVKIFGNSKQPYKTELMNTEVFDFGLQIMTFKVKY